MSRLAEVLVATLVICVYSEVEAGDGVQRCRDAGGMCTSPQHCGTSLGRLDCPSGKMCCNNIQEQIGILNIKRKKRGTRLNKSCKEAGGKCRLTCPSGTIAGETCKKGKNCCAPNESRFSCTGQGFKCIDENKKCKGVEENLPCNKEAKKCCNKSVPRDPNACEDNGNRCRKWDKCETGTIPLGGCKDNKVCCRNENAISCKDINGAKCKNTDKCDSDDVVPGSCEDGKICCLLNKNSECEANGHWCTKENKCGTPINIDGCKGNKICCEKGSHTTSTTSTSTTTTSTITTSTTTTSTITTSTITTSTTTTSTITTSTSTTPPPTPPEKWQRLRIDFDTISSKMEGLCSQATITTSLPTIKAINILLETINMVITDTSSNKDFSSINRYSISGNILEINHVISSNTQNNNEIIQQPFENINTFPEELVNEMVKFCNILSSINENYIKVLEAIKENIGIFDEHEAEEYPTEGFRVCIC